ncbi:MAG: TraR/DksA family transcriptional regulator [Alphaproteobacteria bacterium]|jgi:DnaK suppressor protein|nr:TraR/DksA family transcriptional regulator [Alphaproteobacteria bacterium]
MRKPTKKQLQAAEKRLLARRDELEALAATAEESRQPVELDQTRVGRLSRMDALQDQAMALETERRRNIELRRIEAALGRVADGEYGYCLTCGEEIGAKRLELDPTAPQCVDCAGG